MNAYVEVATANAVAQTQGATVMSLAPVFVMAVASAVAASTERVLNMLRYSIENVAPNTLIIGGTALAA